MRKILGCGILLVVASLILHRCGDRNDLPSVKHTHSLLASAFDEDLAYWVRKEEDKIFESEENVSMLVYLFDVESEHNAYREILQDRSCGGRDGSCLKRHTDHLRRSDSLLVDKYLDLIQTNGANYGLSQEEILSLEAQVLRETTQFAGKLSELSAKSDGIGGSDLNMLHLEAEYQARVNAYKAYSAYVTGGRRTSHPFTFPMIAFDRKQPATSNTLSGDLYVVSALETGSSDIFIIGNDTIPANRHGPTRFTYRRPTTGSDSIQIEWVRTNKITGEVLRFYHVQRVYFE